jgi:hypothetical protein
MHVATPFRPQPGLKQVLNAVMGTAAEIDETRGPPFCWKQSLIRSQQRIIDYNVSLQRTNSRRTNATTYSIV